METTDTATAETRWITLLHIIAQVQHTGHPPPDGGARLLKKHDYVRFAEVLRARKPTGDAEALSQWLNLVRLVTQVLQYDTSQLDRLWFDKATGRITDVPVSRIHQEHHATSLRVSSSSGAEAAGCAPAATPVTQCAGLPRHEDE
jgi:hypothetical protein